jgi:multiple sugar transport system permease protein
MTGDSYKGAATKVAAPFLKPKRRKLSPIQREEFKGFLFLVPAIVYFIVFYGYPIFDNVRMSLERYTAKAFVTGEAPFIGFQNFSHLFTNPDFATVIWNTVLFTVGSLFFQFTIGLAIAVFFQRKFPLSGVLRSLILVPWLAPIIVSGAVWVRLLDMDYGIVNYIIRSLGLTSQHIAWLTDPHLALISVLIANIWIGIPFNMVILYGGLQDIPIPLYEAAAIDGAGPVDKFLYITWPLLRPVSIVVLLLGCVGTIKVFDVIMSITRGGPANVSQILNTWAYSLSYNQLDFGLGAAASDILMLVVFILSLIYLYYTSHQEYKEMGR